MASPRQLLKSYGLNCSPPGSGNRLTLAKMLEMEDVRMERNGTYKTSDIYVAAWLLSKGLQIERLDRRNPRRVDFIFQDRLDRPELVNQFLCGSAIGNVADFVYSMRKCKQLLYSTEV